jgi:hypothetical protein
VENTTRELPAPGAIGGERQACYCGGQAVIYACLITLGLPYDHDAVRVAEVEHGAAGVDIGETMLRVS